jgi:poly(3-hydroxybutyrate) depolymerase
VSSPSLRKIICLGVVTAVAVAAATIDVNVSAAQRVTASTPSSARAQAKKPVHKKKSRRKKHPGRGTGGSRAKCSPAPCSAGTMPSSWSSVTVNDGSGTKTKQMRYKVYRPANLTNSSGNRAPAVIWLDEQLSPAAITSWEQLAVANRFVLVVYQPGTYHFQQGSGTGYFEPVTIPWQPSPVPGCGSSGTGRCDDKPGLVSLLRSVVASQHIDRKRIFVTGASKGGAFTIELMCSASTNKLFRGFGVVSASLWSTGPAERASTNTCRSLNRDSSVMFFAGTADDYIPYGGATMGNRYAWSQPHGVSYLAHRYRCASRPRTTLFGSGKGLARQLYSRCAMPHRAVALISVPHGGHAYGLDGVQGLDSEAELWRFWAAH